MKYSISYNNPATQFIHIKTEVDFLDHDKKQLQLSIWRPGRYERGDFAQYVADFTVTDLNGQKIGWKKKSSALWEIHTDERKVNISYRFHAGILNAGSTWVDAHQLYVNPINCLMFIPGKENEPCILKLTLPENYVVATSMKESPKHTFHVPDFHTLADSPFIASDRLKHYQFDYKDIPFHFWFSGECRPNWKRIQKDTEAIIKKQWQTMENFPTDQYHVLCHVLPHHAYHGVEHTSSTVFTLGPSHELMEPSLYNEFLGIFSHELFHVWNVKTIRPADFFPYDYSKENYSELGYVYEGITTYYGDLFALSSQVFSWDFFAGLLNDWITKYYHNYGRKVYSVAQSSFDTWIDGYKPGIPNRKVNIYNEGALCALMADLTIIHNSSGKFSLDDVARKLNHEFGLLKKGYTRDHYKAILEEYAGTDMDDFFCSFVEGTDDYGRLLFPLLETIGLGTYTKENTSLSARDYGFKIRQEGNRHMVAAIAPNSPAENAGMMLNDEIRTVNGINISNDLDKWLHYFSAEDRIELTVSGATGIRRIFIIRMNKTFYPSYVVLKKENASLEEKEAFKKWSGNNFD